MFELDPSLANFVLYRLSAQRGYHKQKKSSSANLLRRSTKGEEKKEGKQGDSRIYDLGTAHCADVLLLGMLRLFGGVRGVEECNVKKETKRQGLQ